LAAIFISTLAEKGSLGFSLVEVEDPATMCAGILRRGKSGVGDGSPSGTFGFEYSIGVLKWLTRS
jgi:hypothetical protein